MNSRIVKQAFITSLPVMAGYVVLGIGFGILLRGAGYGVLWAFAMSALVYAGAGRSGLRHHSSGMEEEFTCQHPVRNRALYGPGSVGCRINTQITMSVYGKEM